MEGPAEVPFPWGLGPREPFLHTWAVCRCQKKWLPLRRCGPGMLGRTWWLPWWSSQLPGVPVLVPVSSSDPCQASMLL